MKIRIDFVTNSSSSSFMLVIRIGLKNGKILKFKGDGGVCEGDEEYYKLTVNSAPDDMGKCESIDELIKLLCTSVVQGSDSCFEIDEDPGDAAVFTEDSPFIKQLKELKSIDEIKTITVNGDLWGRDWQHQYGHYTYYMEEKKLVYDEGGDDLYDEGTGGSLEFEADENDLKCENFGEAKVEGFKNYDADVPFPKKVEKPNNFIINKKNVLTGYKAKRPEQEVVIPDGVKEIGKNIFKGIASYHVQSVLLPESVVKIGDQAFFSCCSLTRINIPSNVKSIGNDAFYGCGLKKINIPQTVKEIGEGAFSGCTSSL